MTDTRDLSPHFFLPSQPASGSTYGASARKYSNRHPRIPRDNPLPDGTFFPCVSWTSGSVWQSQRSAPCLPTACSPNDTGADRRSQPACVKVCDLFHKEHSSERSQREKEKEWDRGGEGEKEGCGGSGGSQSAGEDGSNISRLRCTRLL